MARWFATLSQKKSSRPVNADVPLSHAGNAGLQLHAGDIGMLQHLSSLVALGGLLLSQSIIYSSVGRRVVPMSRHFDQDVLQLDVLVVVFALKAYISINVLSILDRKQKNYMYHIAITVHVTSGGMRSTRGMYKPPDRGERA